MTRRLKYLPALLLLLSCFCSAARYGYAAENPFDETIRILERWTSSHWGRDCFVWVLHYTDELVEPWVEAEAIKAGMSEADRSAYRENFVSELRLDTSETFLVSIYSFGSRPASLAPVTDNVALITASGERVKPTRYDAGLDYPASGVVQGLVFFPKQRDGGFAIAVKGLGVHEERIFSFDTPRFTEQVSGAMNAPETDVVVVDLPKRNDKPQPVRAPVKKKQPERRTVEPAPETPPPPPQPREVPPLFAGDTKEMETFVKSVKDGGEKKAEKRAEKQSEEKPKENPKPKAETPQPNSENAYVSREYVLRRFLNLWADNKAAEMYDMLSDGSRRVISFENFAKDVAKASDMRAGLRGNYRVEWIGEERAKVIVVRQTLVFRSLSSRTLGVVREASSWKIVW